MIFKYDKVLGKIKEKYGTNKKFAEAIGWSEKTLSLKLNSKLYLRNNEILKICELLDVTKTDIPDYFFTINVQ